MRVLDERHKVAGEALAKGVRPKKVAEMVGVVRGTLYDWMKDPMFKAYVENVRVEIEVQRRERLNPLIDKAAEAVQAVLDNAVRDLKSQDPELRLRAPTVSSLTESLRKLVDLERVERGQPNTISLQRREAERKEAEPQEGDDLVLGLLDTMVEPTLDPEKGN
jgi:hypothetical protein